MSEFQLVTRFQPAGDQPEAIRQMVEGLEAGLSHQTLLGVTGSGKTFSIANVIAQVQRPTLVLAPNKTLAAQLYGEFKSFFPNNAVEYFVSYYDYYQPEAYVPSSDTFIEKDASINDHIEQMRLSATKALLERPDAIIVTTVSCIYGLGSPESYLKMVLHVDRGDKMDQRALLRRLADLQYTRNDMDFARATFRVRGDVIDIYPAESDLEAIRIELFDDEVESISAFDPLTGEVIRKLPRFTFYPKSHYVTPRETLLGAVENIKVELKQRLDYLRGAGKLVGHVAKRNPLWQVPSDHELLVVFQGPSTYISPNWYATKHEAGKVVPTWNYAVVHAHCSLHAIHNPEQVRQVVTELTDQHEASQAHPWPQTKYPRASGPVRTNPPEPLPHPATIALGRTRHQAQDAPGQSDAVPSVTPQLPEPQWNPNSARRIKPLAHRSPYTNP